MTFSHAVQKYNNTSFFLYIYLDKHLQVHYLKNVRIIKYTIQGPNLMVKSIQ